MDGGSTERFPPYGFRYPTPKDEESRIGSRKLLNKQTNIPVEIYLYSKTDEVLAGCDGFGGIRRGKLDRRHCFIWRDLQDNQVVQTNRRHVWQFVEKRGRVRLF